MAKNLKLHTQVPVSAPKQKIRYGEKLLATGSCFVENIGSKLAQQAYSIKLNPFGISYNPLSIFQGLRRLQAGKLYKQAELFEHRGRWQSFDHHSRLAAATAQGCLQQINEQVQQAHQHLQETKVLLLTLGTSWIYRLKANHQLVNNCHQLPASEFVRERLSVEEIVAKGLSTLRNLQAALPKLQVWFTISPVRHLKDGPQENQLSKAVLLLAVEQLVEQLPNSYYFPAYEIQLDELRDYRFYGRDLAHPNDLAIDYIWQRFEEACLLEEEAPLRRRVEKLRLAAAHRPFYPNSASHQEFVQQQIQKIEQLEKEYPSLDLTLIRKSLIIKT